MGIFEFRATRVVNTDGVFEPFKNGDSDIGGLFVRLKNLVVSEIHTQWDIAFLETYVKKHMVPRSLRWDVGSQRGENDLEGWYKYFNEAGISLLRFLLERKASKLARLHEEIRQIKDKLTPFQSGEEYLDRSKNLLKFLEKEDREQKIKKRKKYNRDIADYESHIVFEWQKKILAEQTGEATQSMDTAPCVTNQAMS